MATVTRLPKDAKAARPGLFDVLHIVSVHFTDEGNAAVCICPRTWRDVRIWTAIIEMRHKPKRADGEVDMEAPRLVIASERGRLDVAQRLLDLGANIEAASASGNTALALACINGHEHMSSLLLDRHANIDVLNNDNRSALFHACYWANVKVVRVLLERGANANLGLPPILDACQEVHEDYRAQVDDMSTFWARRLQVVRLLADHNANLNVVDEDGRAALTIASECNQVDIINFLLDRDVDLDALNNNNASALCQACFYANVEAACVLLARGANVNLGEPPILEVCRSLNADDQAEADMTTFWANRCEIVIELVRHNANLDAVDVKLGLTPVQLAIRNNQQAIAAVIQTGSAFKTAILRAREQLAAASP